MRPDRLSTRGDPTLPDQGSLKRWRGIPQRVTVGCGLAAILWAWYPAHSANVLLLIADDFGLDSHALYNDEPGAELPATPNIDALKTTGVQFLQTYAYPTCSPTRASILTGRHPFRHGVARPASVNDGQLSAGEFTLPRAFEEAEASDYMLAHFGKWHLTAGPDTSEDPENIGGWPHFSGSLGGGLSGNSGTYTSWTKTINGVTGATNSTTTYATTDTTNDALAWINARNSDPWFAWVAYNAPHTPFHKPPDDLHTYDDTVPNWATLPINANQRLHYNAAVQALDTEIGRLLANIDPTVLADTWVIFIGDNGTPAQVVQTPYSDSHAKGTLYEGGVRVPMLISGPGVVSPNRVNGDLVQVVDLYATILEMAGIDVTAVQPAVKPLDSRSLMPLLKHQTLPARSAWSEQYSSTLDPSQSGRIIREGDYKLILFDDGVERLHHVPTDPDEQTNLLDAPLSPTVEAAYTQLDEATPDFIAAPNVLNLPLETQWQKMTGAEYARIYRTQNRALSGTADTTWDVGGRVTGGGQPTPAYAGIANIRVSADWVYVKGSALPHYTMGPWYFDAAKTELFVNLPSQWDLLARIPRRPQAAAKRSNTDFGPIAIWVNSAIIHNQLDAFYWNGTADVDDSATGTEYWTRNARLAEGLTFDPAGAHQPFTGESHHHISPTALRAELGDRVIYDSVTHTYSEDTTTPALHSPILGWSFDGYPIYGPYGFDDPADPGSGVRRMVSGFVLRDGQSGTTDLAVTGRTTLPAWAVRAGHGDSPVADAVAGPPVDADFPLGWYLQDFDYLGDLGHTPGSDFDLDACNGRWCVTPEFPEGIYAYFVTLDANHEPAYPYIIGRQYYGVKQGGNFGGAATVGFAAVDTPLETLYSGGASSPPIISQVQPSGSEVILQWDSVEGGSYTIQSAVSLPGWEAADTGVTGEAFTTEQPVSSPSNDRGYFRVRLDSVSAYDELETP